MKCGNTATAVGDNKLTVLFTAHTPFPHAVNNRGSPRLCLPFASGDKKVDFVASI